MSSKRYLLKCEQSRCHVVEYSKSNITPHVTPLWPRALNICNRCQGFKSRWLLLYLHCSPFSVSPVRFRSSIRLSISPSPSSVSLSFAPSLSATLYFHSPFSPFLESLIDSSCSRSFSLSRVRFSALPSIAILLYLFLTWPPCSLVECSSLLLDFGKAVSPNVKADLFRTRDVCNDIPVRFPGACYPETCKLFAINIRIRKS